MLLPNKSKHILGVHMKHYWHFQRVTLKQYNALLQRSNSTDIFRVLLRNNTNFPSFRIIVKQYWHFERVTGKQCYISRVYIKQYWHFQRVPSKLNYSKNFSEFILHNTDTFRELLPSNIDLFRAHIK